MPSNYTGNPAATQAPGPTPGIGALPIIALPVDADAANAASIYQPLKEVADFIAYLQSHAPTIAPWNDGSDGDHTESGTLSPVRTMFWRNLTLTASGIYHSGSTIVFVSDTLTIASGGYIDGGIAGGAAFLELAGTTDGGAGGLVTGSNGNSPAGEGFGGSGGNGGSGLGTGGTGGTAAATTNIRLYTPFNPGYRLRVNSGETDVETVMLGGGGGGGGGGANGVGGSLGGTGGKGGRPVVVIANKVVLGANNSIRSEGFAGGNGTVAGDGGGGGGGGVVVLQRRINSGTALTSACVPGGAGGNGVGGGANGAAGSTGNFYELLIG